MKICLINNLYQPYNRGGAERVTETIANGLVRAGYEVFIVCTKPRFAKLRITNYELRIYYLNSLYYYLDEFPKFLRLVWHLWDMFDLVNYFKVKRILRRENCDAVITNNLMGLGFLAPRAIRKLKIRQLHLAHDLQLIHPSGLLYYGREKAIDSYSARNYAGLMSRIVDSPDIVIFPSRWLLDMHLDKIFFIKSKRLVLPNPVAAAPAAGTKRPGGNFKFLFIGQIEEHKGVFLLIEAFKTIKRKYPEAELTIAGNGSKRTEAEALGAGVKFLDWPGEAAADKLLSSSHCLVYPSLVYENCPNAIQRALAAGLPVLASELGGIPELLSKNAGILFKPADVEKLAEKMEWIINNQENLNEIITAGKEKAALFGIDNYLKEILKLIA